MVAVASESRQQPSGPFSCGMSRNGGVCFSDLFSCKDCVFSSETIERLNGINAGGVARIAAITGTAMPDRKSRSLRGVPAINYQFTPGNKLRFLGC